MNIIVIFLYLGIKISPHRQGYMWKSYVAFNTCSGALQSMTLQPWCFYHSFLFYTWLCLGCITPWPHFSPKWIQSIELSSYPCFSISYHWAQQVPTVQENLIEDWVNRSPEIISDCTMLLHLWKIEDWFPLPGLYLIHSALFMRSPVHVASGTPITMCK